MADDGSSMKLIVGLGNPGKRYENTKHNVGFDVLGALAQRHFATSPRSKFQGELSEARIRDRRVLLLCPLTYMNLSGGSVLAARDFYKLSLDDILIVCDDFALSLGQLRFRPNGSSGGQKGLGDIINRIGKDIPRLRVGIGPLPPQWDVADFVLSKFSKEEREQVDLVLQTAVKSVADWVEHGVAHCMNQYNATGKKPKPKKKPAKEKAAAEKTTPEQATNDKAPIDSSKTRLEGAQSEDTRSEDK